jgi:ribosome assembly protein RRB1
MGKKSKRPNHGSGSGTSNGKRSSAADGGAARPAPNLRTQEEETMENLRFEDPFVDEIVEDDDGDDDVMDDNDDEEEYNDDDDDEEDDSKAGGIEVIQSWHPLMGGEQPEALEMDPTAYKMHHTLTPEWPSLSFDFLRDDLGDARKRFPHSFICAVGTQAPQADKNQLTIMKLSDLSKIQTNEKEEDILGEEYNPDKEDDSSSSSEEEDIDMDPILEHYSLPHHGGVNRLRAMPQQSSIISTWSDAGQVNVYNVEHILNRFTASQGKSAAAATTKADSNKPFFSYQGHPTEGYAMNWSPVQQGHLATGDCLGNIHLWTPRDGGGSYEVTPSYDASNNNDNDNKDHNPSVEDLQWSPTEATVFGAAECGGMIRIYDTRAPHRAMLSHKIHKNGADVNVLSWNKLVSNLLATGGDDGTLSVWDLRHFSASATTTTTPSTTEPAPLARFSCHKSPITSVEWHPTDESMLACTDDVGAYIYDLSVEEDDNTINAMDIPPQMLFSHSGSQEFKELHWHPQISSCIMTTALTGFSVFIPSNL